MVVKIDDLRGCLPMVGEWDNLEVGGWGSGGGVGRCEGVGDDFAANLVAELAVQWAAVVGVGRVVGVACPSDGAGVALGVALEIAVFQALTVRVAASGAAGDAVVGGCRVEKGALGASWRIHLQNRVDLQQSLGVVVDEKDGVIGSYSTRRRGEENVISDKVRAVGGRGIVVAVNYDVRREE